MMAADLIARGARKQEIIENIYQKNSPSYYRILGECLNKLEIIDSKICIAIVTKEMLDKYGLEYGDIDAIIPYTRDIDGVELGIFVKQKELDEIRVSLRSKSYIDCTELAATFGASVIFAGSTSSCSASNARIFSKVSIPVVSFLQLYCIRVQPAVPRKKPPVSGTALPAVQSALFFYIPCSAYCQALFCSN